MRFIKKTWPSKDIFLHVLRDVTGLLRSNAFSINEVFPHDCEPVTRNRSSFKVLSLRAGDIEDVEDIIEGMVSTGDFRSISLDLTAVLLVVAGICKGLDRMVDVLEALRSIMRY